MRVGEVEGLGQGDVEVESEGEGEVEVAAEGVRMWRFLLHLHTLTPHLHPHTRVYLASLLTTRFVYQFSNDVNRFH